MGAEFFDQARNKSIGLGRKRVKEMFYVDGGVPGAGGVGLGGGDGLLGVLGEFIYIHVDIIKQIVWLSESKMGERGSGGTRLRADSSHPKAAKEDWEFRG